MAWRNFFPQRPTENTISGRTGHRSLLCPEKLCCRGKGIEGWKMEDGDDEEEEEGEGRGGLLYRFSCYCLNA